MMLRQRRGGAPPRDLESWCGLTNHVLRSMSIGSLDVILCELSKERMVLMLMSSLEKVIRKCGCGWSVKVRRRQKSIQISIILTEVVDGRESTTEISLHSTHSI